MMIDTTVNHYHDVDRPSETVSIHLEQQATFIGRPPRKTEHTRYKYCEVRPSYHTSHITLTPIKSHFQLIVRGGGDFGEQCHACMHASEEKPGAVTEDATAATVSANLPFLLPLSMVPKG